MTGCALYQIIYPGNIRVFPGETFFDYQGERYCLAVSPHVKSVSSLSIHDEIVRTPFNNDEGYKYNFLATTKASDNQLCNFRLDSEGELDVSLLMDTNGVDHFRLSHSSTVTHVRVAIEADSLSQATYDKAVSAFNHFIRVYRYASLDIKVKETCYMTGFKPFIYACYHQYSPEELIEVHDKRVYELLSKWSPSAKMLSSMQEPNLLDNEIENFNRQSATGHIAYYLSAADFPEWRITLIRAYELALEQKNYNAAILELFIALELALFNLLREIRTPGATKLKKYDNIFEVIDKALPKLFGSEVDELKDKFHFTRKVRNKIVHRGYFATESECSKCLRIADEGFKFIDTKI
ncbi:MAG: hypothetical protein ACJAXJ_001268 [Colwellia sp.]